MTRTQRPVPVPAAPRLHDCCTTERTRQWFGSIAAVITAHTPDCPAWGPSY
ncbi:hypothetical protein ACIREE_40815 [Streptomyces sp. NPDC102467]|uniref:hypothetical protein n=1 Tax=Streptomyces sp. NPDC102467 TaxID=3366179 RepID=UPI003810CE33